MTYRLIALDLDETLLDNNFQISERNKKTIEAAREKGVKVVIASGRMFSSSLPYARELKLDTPIIAYQGALIRSVQNGEDYSYCPLDFALALPILEDAQKMGYHINLYLDDKLYVKEENNFTRLYQAIASIEIHPVGELSAYLRKVRQNPIKLTIIDYEGKLSRMQDYLQREYGEMLNVIQSHRYFLELTDRKASKGQALHILSGMLDIKQEEIMAIGDSYNDLDMIKYAGLGVAVSNAREAIRAEADYITASNLADGVADAIEQFVL